MKTSHLGSPLFTSLLELGYGFTVGLLGNAIALVCSLFWFLPRDIKRDFLIFFLALDVVVWLVLGILQIVGFVYCLVDLSRRSTHQSWWHVALVAVGIVLNCLPLLVYSFITGLQGNGVGA